MNQNLATSNLLKIVPIEHLSLSSQLDGSLGTNRAVGNRPQIAANTDTEAIKVWLARYLDTKTTFDSYRKEAERLLIWSVSELGKPLSSLTHEDLLVFQHFLANPQPERKWIMPNRKVARDDDRWRPFAGPLSPTSQRQAFVILNGMFSWLVNAGYLAGNPLSLSRNRQRKAKPRVTRFLDEELWSEVKITVESMPKQTNRDREHYHRVRWLISLLYVTGIRISEIAENTMGGFFGRVDKENEIRYWLEITGKGEKTRTVPATKSLMNELYRYRREMGFPLQLNTEKMYQALRKGLGSEIRKAILNLVECTRSPELDSNPGKLISEIDAGMHLVHINETMSGKDIIPAKLTAEIPLNGFDRTEVRRLLLTFSRPELVSTVPILFYVEYPDLEFNRYKSGA